MIKGSDYHGSLVWKTTDPRNMTLEAIPKHAEVEINDTIMTSGFSSIFPEGVMIGVIDTVWREAGSNFHTIDVKLSSDLNKVRNVYVVKDMLKKEKLELEKETLDE